MPLDTSRRQIEQQQPAHQWNGTGITLVPMTIRFLFSIWLLLQPFASGSSVLAQESRALPTTAHQQRLNLTQAVLCETIANFKPVNQSKVFPVSRGTIMCFTEFDVVPHETELYHVWIKRDALVYRKPLILKPPRWASVSSIKLREADKGPWRVEIRDADGRLYATLRFSVTD
jgi:hypothetical protein